MSDIIKRHNFDQALRRIEQFSNSTPSVPYIGKFETDGGLFGWGDHYINGYEMNNYVEKVQDHFTRQNSVLINTIKEFREIYNTFNFLDKEYLQGIVSAVEAANKASEGAKVASGQAKEAAVKALKNEEDIRKEVEALRRIVEKIKSIREDLNTKISKLENSIEDNRAFFSQEISKRTLSNSEIQTLKSNLRRLSEAIDLSDKVELLWTELEDNIEQLNFIKELLTEYKEESKSDILNINKDIEVRHKTLSQYIEKVKGTVSKLREECIRAIENLRSENDKFHKEVSNRFEKTNRTAAAQREEYSGAIKNLKRENDQRHQEVSGRLEQTNRTITENQEDHINTIKALKQQIESQNQEHTRQIDVLSESLVKQNKELRKKIITAWIIGSLGIIGSIIAMVI